MKLFSVQFSEKLTDTASETVEACFAFQQDRAGLLCTEAIVQTPNQTVSHAKHSRSSPPTLVKQPLQRFGSSQLHLYICLHTNCMLVFLNVSPAQDVRH